MRTKSALFKALPRSEREGVAADFLAFSINRDGEPNFDRRTLAKREARAAERSREWLAIHREPPVSQSEFESLLTDKRSTPSSPLVAWLVDVARANEGEAWGVDYLLGRTAERSQSDPEWKPTPRDVADLQETYHTRTLADIVGLFGDLRFRISQPDPVVAALVKAISIVPGPVRSVLLVTGEIVGAVAFLDLSNQGALLLEDESADLRRAVQELLDSILTDEIGHITSLLASMNSVQMRAVRCLIPIVGRGVALSYGRNVAEETARRRELLKQFSLSIFPAHVVARSFLPRALGRFGALAPNLRT